VDSQLSLNEELRKLVETRMQQTLKGIEDTLRRILEHQELSNKDLTAVIQSLEASFALLSQKWTLEILYTLFLKTTFGFSGLKKTLGVNSRTLSDKLKRKKCHFTRVATAVLLSHLTAHSRRLLIRVSNPPR
jgi:hypothetical protein